MRVVCKSLSLFTSLVVTPMLRAAIALLFSAQVNTFLIDLSITKCHDNLDSLRQHEISYTLIAGRVLVLGR